MNISALFISHYPTTIPVLNSNFIESNSITKVKNISEMYRTNSSKSCLLTAIKKINKFQTI